jgi:hypothetical protein
MSLLLSDPGWNGLFAVGFPIILAALGTVVNLIAGYLLTSAASTWAVQSLRSDLRYGLSRWSVLAACTEPEKGQTTKNDGLPYGPTLPSTRRRL